jgi:hypothetical protein
METAAQTCLRLIGALEELGVHEKASLAARDFPAVALVQERAAPLVAHLAEHGPSVADDELRRRIAAWLARRHEYGEWLAAQIARAKQELAEIEASERRIRRVSPAYAREVEAASRWSATG